jgi:hypothetical protein
VVLRVAGLVLLRVRVRARVLLRGRLLLCRGLAVMLLVDNARGSGVLQMGRNRTLLLVVGVMRICSPAAKASGSDRIDPDPRRMKTRKSLLWGWRSYVGVTGGLQGSRATAGLLECLQAGQGKSRVIMPVAGRV